MTTQTFLTHLADAMQRDEPLSAQMRLDSIEEWDSLAVVSLIALFHSLFGMQISGNDLAKCECISDIIALAGAHIEA
ncbi:acyl carrier protein [Helicobacter jaachi]|uniref:Acyl carrier protein n=1 Tax=Helicobacter jaachi TaxID=1677920 RepID=A0A4U8TA00_9HELI|nr:phosphopantetheine-binding protein [Helicobacter jaachi]TLD96493.1 acyl carrier protein [Helicobacter jaachi]